MPKTHVVVPGECLCKIAWQHGAAEPERVWAAPENEGLRKRRPNPDVLMPGDHVSVPDFDPKTVDLTTNQRHRVTVTVPRRELRMRIRTVQGEPIADAPYELALDGAVEPRQGTTDKDGQVRELVPLQAIGGLLAIGGRRYRLRFSHLDPLPADEADRSSGVASRLGNLGYAPGKADSASSPALSFALALFQADAGMEVSGEVDEGTRQKLMDEHGS